MQIFWKRQISTVWEETGRLRAVVYCPYYSAAEEVTGTYGKSHGQGSDS